MLKFNVDIVIEKPIKEVFGFVVKGENGSLWNSVVKNVKKIEN
jgi:hypothetical protein